MSAHTPIRDAWCEAPSNFRPPSPDPLRDTDVRAALRRGDGARAFIAIHGSSAALDAMTDAELDALRAGSRRIGHR